jgi:hypothetical protein
MIKSTHLAQALAEEFPNAEDETEAFFFIKFVLQISFFFSMHSQTMAKT